MQNTPQVTLAELALEQAQKQLAVNSSLFQGEASLGYSQTWGELNAASLAEPQSLDDGDWQPISVSGRLNVIPAGPFAETVQRAQWDVERAERNLKDERYAAFIDLTERFQSALAAKQSAEVERLALEIAELELQRISMLLASGSANESQKRQVELAVLQALESARLAEASFQQSLMALSISLGETVTDVSGTLPVSKRPANEAALSQRSDVVNARVSVQDAELNIPAALRQALPTASLSLNYGLSPEDGRFDVGARIDSSALQPNLSLSYDLDATNPSPLEGASSSSFSLSLSASIPLDFSVADALAAVQLNVQQAELRAEQSLELAKLDLATKEAQATSSEVQLALAEQSWLVRQDAFVTAQIRLDAGLITNLDLKQAELDLARAELSVFRAQNSARLAHMSLAVAYAVNPLEVF